MSKTKVLLSVLFGTIALGAVIQVSASNFLSTDGIDLAQIQNRIEVLKKENMVLQEKIYARASLTQVASEAATLGFVPQGATVFVTGTRPIALKP